MKNLFQVAAELAFVDPLDAMLNDAVREQAKRTVRALPSKEDKPLVPKAKLTSGFYLAQNWETRRVISLIHRETNTLLGNFTEQVYLPNPRTKRFTRVDSPMPTDGTDYVSGDWWLRQETERHTDPKSWIESRDAIIGITLAECGLHCDMAEVTVRLEHGWIARVELRGETRFTCAQRNTFLILHAGLDVLEGMSLDSKLALKSELHIGEEEET